MPPRPKKRQRVSGAHAADAATTGVDVAAVPTSMTAAPPVMQKALAMVDAMFELRHATEKTLHMQPVGCLTPKDGTFHFPLSFGGTFVQISQRAWTDADKLLEESTQLASMVGFLDGADVNEFLHNFCKMQAIAGSMLYRKRG